MLSELSSRRWSAWILIGFVSALTLSACGGDDSNPTPTEAVTVPTQAPASETPATGFVDGSPANTVQPITELPDAATPPELSGPASPGVISGDIASPTPTGVVGAPASSPSQQAAPTSGSLVVPLIPVITTEATTRALSG
nr:hypothetical protein [Chloroflexia bacterium]